MLYAKEIEHRLVAHKNEAYSCEEVSSARNIPVSDVLKCILAVDKERVHYLFCIPGDCRLDLDKCRIFLSSSALRFATREEAEAITGSKIGAIHPFFHRVKIPIIFDSAILSKNVVDISSGDPHAGIQIRQKLLCMLVNPKIASITQSPYPQVPKLGN